MHVEDALSTRYSARAFLPKQVDRELIEAVIKAAMRTPSWANTQPWELFVASGESIERIRNGFAECYEKNQAPEFEIPRPLKWSEKAKSCTKELTTAQREGEYSEAFKQFFDLNCSFFNAPMVVYLCMDSILGQWSLFDLGAFSQSFMLSATEHGLQTVPAINLVMFPKIIREELAVPEDQKIVFGIACGYADESHGVNVFRSSRRDFEDVVSFFD